jgi:hypothetical protein
MSIQGSMQKIGERLEGVSFLILPSVSKLLAKIGGDLVYVLGVQDPVSPRSGYASSHESRPTIPSFEFNIGDPDQFDPY